MQDRAASRKRMPMSPYTKRLRASGITLKDWAIQRGFNYWTVRKVVQGVDQGRYDSNVNGDIGQMIIYAMNQYLEARRA